MIEQSFPTSYQDRTSLVPYIFGTGSAGASETLAGDDRHLRAGVFLPFLFRGFTESLNAVKLVCVHHWP